MEYGIIKISSGIYILSLALLVLAPVTRADDEFHRGFQASERDADDRGGDANGGTRAGGTISLPGKSRGIVSTTPAKPTTPKSFIAKRSTGQAGAYNPPVLAASRGFGPSKGRGGGLQIDGKEVTDPKLLSVYGSITQRHETRLKAIPQTKVSPPAPDDLLATAGGQAAADRLTQQARAKLLADSVAKRDEEWKQVSSAISTLTKIAPSTTSMTETVNGQTVTRTETKPLTEKDVSTIRTTMLDVTKTLGRAEGADALIGATSGAEAHTREYVQAAAEVMRKGSFFDQYDQLKAQANTQSFAYQGASMALDTGRTDLVSATKALGFAHSGEDLINGMQDKATRAKNLANAIGTNPSILTDMQNRERQGQLRPGEAELLALYRSAEGQAAYQQNRTSASDWNKRREAFFTQNPNATPEEVRKNLLTNSKGGAMTDYINNRRDGKGPSDAAQFQQMLRGMGVTGSDKKGYVVMERTVDGKVERKLFALGDEKSNLEGYDARRKAGFKIADPESKEAKELIEKRNSTEKQLAEIKAKEKESFDAFQLAAQAKGDKDYDTAKKEHDEAQQEAARLGTVMSSLSEVTPSATAAPNSADAKPAS